jgi:L-ascorbate metabolism protein UlaG (beta-lactamase superfamily)
MNALNERGFAEARGLDTWESVQFERGDWTLTVTSTPGRHGPPMSDYVLPDVMGSVLDFRSNQGDSYRMYITGDTLVYEDIRTIPERFSGVDLALLHLGGTRVFGILVTMDADQGVEMLRIIEPEMAIPIHYNDYDVFTSSLEDFIQAVQDAGLGEKVHALRHGETYVFSARRGAQEHSRLKQAAPSARSELPSTE